jgi:hypothetical protein
VQWISARRTNRTPIEAPHYSPGRSYQTRPSQGHLGEQPALGGDGAALAVGELEIAVAQFQDGDVGVGAAALMREPGMREPGGVAAVLGDRR